MRVRKTRNDTDFWYCQYDPTVQHIVVDENGHETGEIVPHYGAATPYWANVSPAAGAAQFEQFGNMGNYDRVIVTRDMTCPINENSVLFLEKEPEYTELRTEETVDGKTTTVVYLLPKYDYLVKNVAKGLDAIAIAVRKVDVG